MIQSGAIFWQPDAVGALLGELLPLAVGVAISPIPIIAAILMLLSSNAGRASLGFAAGWVAGIVAVTAVAAAVAQAGDGRHAGESTSPVIAWVKIALGIVLVLLAIRQWRGRGDGAEPGWMKAVDQLGTVKAAGLGAALAAANPKNLVLGLAAGATIGGSGQSSGTVIIAVVVFTLIATSTVLGPVLAYTVAGDRMRATLDNLKSWLQTYNAQVMAVVLLVLGAGLAGKGLAGL